MYIYVYSRHMDTLLHQRERENEIDSHTQTDTDRKIVQARAQEHIMQSPHRSF